MQIGLLPYTKKWFTSDSTPGCPLDYCSVYRRFFWLVTWALNRPDLLGEFSRGGKGLYATMPPRLLGVVQSLLLSAYEGVLPLDAHDCAGLRASGPETGFYRRNPDPGGVKRDPIVLFLGFSPNLIIFFGEQ